MAKVSKAPSMQDILDTPMSSIEPPKPIPTGVYTAMVVGHANEDTASTGTRFVQFTLQLQSFENDDEEASEELQEALTKLDGTIMPLSDKTIQSERYYLTDASLYRLRKFLNDLGIDNTGNVREALLEVPGKMVMITVVHRVGSSGGIFTNVSQTSPIG